MYLLPERSVTTLDYIHCMDALSLLRGLSSKSINLIVTSPPYDNLRSYGGNWSFPFEAIAQESYRVLVDGGVLVWVVDDSMKDGCSTLTSMRQALYFTDCAGFNMHQRIVWEKRGLPHKRPAAYLDDFEDVYVLSKGTPATFNPIMKVNKYAGEQKRKGHSGRDGFEYTDGYRVVPDKSLLTNVWTITVGYGHSSKDKIAHEHPAIFPEELARRHIMTWTNPGDVVLDYFAGSGTTCKMARNLNRRYIGGDINAAYVDLARRRLAQPYTLSMFDRIEKPAVPVQMAMAIP